jgi:outer membrane protein OmpA-like peptidoglycan-associated protein
MKRGWCLEAKNHWSAEGYWASYSDLMAGVLLVFAVAAASAWIEFQARLVQPTQTMKQWQQASQRLCTDESLKQGTAIRIDCSTGTLLISEESLRYETSKTELSENGRAVLSKIVPLYLERYLAAVCGQEPDCESLKGIEISGHTDATGSFQLNGQIGSERATRVLDFMTTEPVFERFHVLLRAKAFTTGYADTRPPSGRQRRNDAWDEARRIEVQIHFDAERVLRDVNRVLSELENGRH